MKLSRLSAENIYAMAYHPRQNSPHKASLQTSRSRNSELWFVNNRPLEKSILGYLAKFVKRYSVKLYAFAIEGNHTHEPAMFPLMNRSAFKRDLNSCIASAVKRFCPTFPGGNFFARRFSAEVLPSPSDIEEYFFYTVMQPIKDGLVTKLSEYPFYNCFHDAIWGIPREFEVMDWAGYNAAKRYNPQVKKKDFIEKHLLLYERIPGYEHMSQKDYAEMMLKKYEERRIKLVAEHLAEGKSFMGREALRKVVPGSLPHNTKKSTITSHRPRVLCKDRELREAELELYFQNHFDYRAASLKYREGDLSAVFPFGMNKPLIPICLPNSPPTGG